MILGHWKGRLIDGISLVGDSIIQNGLIDGISLEMMTAKANWVGVVEIKIVAE